MVAAANSFALVAVVGIIVLSVLVGSVGQRWARTTSDVLVASRAIDPRLNALAICGEYLSAGTYLGLASLVLVAGVDMLWYPVGYTMGYVFVLCLVAAPMRRFGAYTISDFAAARLAAPWMRRLSTLFVLVICWLYLVPQMKGAGVVLRSIAGVPYWVGVVVVGVVITISVAFGGMRSITYVQAMHYLVKAFALSFVAVVLLVVWQAASGRPVADDGPLRFAESTEVRVEADTTIRADAATIVQADGLVDGQVAKGEMTLTVGEHQVGASTTLRFDKGAPVPVRADLPRSDGTAWLQPVREPEPAQRHPMYFVYSVILATFLGTMGLPHILVRFYTNPNGDATRRTTVTVIALLGCYYVFPPLFGVLGRTYAGDLLLTGQTDALVLTLPERMFDGSMASILVAILACGAFAAFISTASGLLVTMAGSTSHDLFDGRVSGFRIATVCWGATAIAVGLLVRPFGINVLVGWAFAIAAATFCPVVLLGVWWRRLTATGAAAGMVTGGVLSAAAIAVTMARTDLDGWPEALLAQPAAWAVPTAFLVTIAVSLRTQHAVPPTTTSMLVSMHVPESLGVARPLRP
jgi:Na+(H+)/acetate symporter ActP